MRDLLMQVQPHVWTQVSSAIFMTFFALLLLWVYLPSRKQRYEKFSKIPLDLE